VGVLSLAVDLGVGQPMEHVARSCRLAWRLGDHIGLAERERVSLYYVAMLGWVGCIADSPRATQWFGDDIEYRAGVYDLDMKPLPFLGYLLRHAGAGQPPLQRAAKGALVLADGGRGVQDSLRTHCQVSSTIAARLGLGEDVTGPLSQIFARWDGKGLPARLGGTAIALTVRLWQLSDVVEVHHHRAGVRAAVDVARARRGGQFDPHLVDVFVEHATELLEPGEGDASWTDLVAAEPALRVSLTEGELDRTLEVFADYADVKSPYLRGHSRGVAVLAAAAGERLGLDQEEVVRLRRAALLHDLGRTGVPNTIWDKAGPLSAGERERLRLHAYYTDRMLCRPPTPPEVGTLAAAAHERLDGSGYHRGLSGEALSMPARVLAAANCFHAMLEPRPHRPMRTRSEAVQVLEEESRAGRLDATAVDAVLACAGHRARRPPRGPAGLTPREVEVLALLARGATNRQIGRRLGIAPNTVGKHLEHAYAKTGVSGRAAATLFAMQHGLVRTLDRDT
jgi:HD-GYP domain-containing protein (c-di-GMP phosphodiesterase class II)